MGRAEGREALVAHIGGFHEMMPGNTIYEHERRRRARQRLPLRVGDARTRPARSRSRAWTSARSRPTAASRRSPASSDRSPTRDGGEMLLDGVNHVGMLTERHRPARRVLPRHLRRDGARGRTQRRAAAHDDRHRPAHASSTCSRSRATRRPSARHRCSAAGRLDHIGLQAASKEAFDEIRRRLIACGATDGFVTDFGMALSLFFVDPDGLEGEVLDHRARRDARQPARHARRGLRTRHLTPAVRPGDRAQPPLLRARSSARASTAWPARGRPARLRLRRARLRHRTLDRSRLGPAPRRVRRQGRRRRRARVASKPALPETFEGWPVGFDRDGNPGPHQVTVDDAAPVGCAGGSAAMPLDGHVDGRLARDTAAAPARRRARRGVPRRHR